MPPIEPFDARNELELNLRFTDSENEIVKWRMITIRLEWNKSALLRGIGAAHVSRGVDAIGIDEEPIAHKEVELLLLEVPSVINLDKLFPQFQGIIVRKRRRTGRMRMESEWIRKWRKSKRIRKTGEREEEK